MYMFLSLLSLCLVTHMSWYLTMWEFAEYGNIREYEKENWRI